MSIIKKKSVGKFFLHSSNAISIVKDSTPNYIGSMDRMNWKSKEIMNKNINMKKKNPDNLFLKKKNWVDSTSE